MCVCCPSGFPQRSQLFLYSVRASLTHRGVPAAYHTAKAIGNNGLKYLKKVKKIFQPTIFYTTSPTAKYQKANWLEEDSLG